MESTPAAGAASWLEATALVIARGAFHLGPLDLHAARGACVWIAGPNGAGKSTLLEGIAGLAPCAGGTLRLGGHDVARQPPWQRDATLLLQQLGLWPHLTVRRQAHLYADTAAGTGVVSTGVVSTAQRVRDLAEALDVTRFLDAHPGRLSGGEAQRCALVRTLARARTLVLLDEPYAAQHADGVARIDAVLAQLSAAGHVVLVAGHRAPPGARTVALSPLSPPSTVTARP